MQAETILATGAAETSDPRLEGRDAGSLSASELFDAADETALEVSAAGRRQRMGRVDSDEELCSLVVIGYPNYASVEAVGDYFRNAAPLRGPPTRAPGRTTERVTVTFETEKDARFAMEWFRNPKRTMVAGHVVAVERVKERKTEA